MSRDLMRGRVDLSAYDTPEMRRLVQEKMESLKNDALVYPVISTELKLTHKEVERHLAALLDYQEDANYCANCPGLEHCAKGHPHFRLRLERDGELLNRHYDPCEKMLSLSSFQQRYLRCSFPATWRDENLSSIERSVSSRNAVLLAMGRIVQGNVERWPFLTGSAGSGKSFMLACLANHITLNGGVGVYSDSESLFAELKEKSIKDREGFDALMKSIGEAAILVLDDFGNEYKTEYVYTSILFPLLSARDRANLPTAFSSDFKIEEIVSMYRAKIGPERANQLKNLLKRRCVKEFDVTGVSIY